MKQAFCTYNGDPSMRQLTNGADRIIVHRMAVAGLSFYDVDSVGEQLQDKEREKTSHVKDAKHGISSSGSRIWPEKSRTCALCLEPEITCMESPPSSSQPCSQRGRPSTSNMAALTLGGVGREYSRRWLGRQFNLRFTKSRKMISHHPVNILVKFSLTSSFILLGWFPATASQTRLAKARYLY
ncbi:hypothetical protein L228DRAFT_54910 [Xylona heveae TC161]|uniref:Uncharacterized protein n=1 Tax=Xylona heveae (strain CBS 132557 / TC161) TaxID=1328760 RepID=A0A164ZAT4_XYLHT|nr:hypothetical protein L228DRAFT_54910 [Xylona heveae TC161]KZF18877.1 hypothetical protein L228DRAFT_54910 [Xylona heveae TC161]